MGWWSATKRAGRVVGSTLKNYSGEIARNTAVAAAGAAGATVCAPVGLSAICAVGAAYTVNATLGDRIERVTKRTIDRSGSAADDFVSYLRGGDPAPRPPGMATTVEGMPLATAVKGDVLDSDTGLSVPYLTAISAGVIATAAMVLLVLRRTGKL